MQTCRHADIHACMQTDGWTDTQIDIDKHLNNSVNVQPQMLDFVVLVDFIKLCGYPFGPTGPTGDEVDGRPYRAIPAPRFLPKGHYCFTGPIPKVSIGWALTSLERRT